MLITKRLTLRQWRESDLLPFAQMTADRDVMRYFPQTLTTKESDQLAHKIKKIIDKNHWGFWATELLETKQFIGFIGLNIPDYTLPFSLDSNTHHPPCVEIGWRLNKEHWGNGYAVEGALAALKFGFIELNLTEIISFTPTINYPSERVMQKIGMKNSNSNFMHPKIDKEHLLCQHVLYKINKNAFTSPSEFYTPHTAHKS